MLCGGFLHAMTMTTLSYPGVKTRHAPRTRTKGDVLVRSRTFIMEGARMTASPDHIPEWIWCYEEDAKILLCCESPGGIISVTVRSGVSTSP